MSNDQTIYYTCVETAKRLRAALKEAFPGAKFSVRYTPFANRGGDIDVAWIDGPTQERVQLVCNEFQGSDFDPMNDLTTPRLHMVNGTPVHYGADFITTRRQGATS